MNGERKRASPPVLSGAQGGAVSLIVPAYNEGKRIERVLEVVTRDALAEEVLVVNDGSTDDTSFQARKCPRAFILDLPRNVGKGGAMYAGALLSRHPVLVFLDADLVGLHAGHVEQLLQPVRSGEADMCIALFHGGRFSTDFSHRIAAWVTGQRAIRRDLFLSLSQVVGVRSGVETVITRCARKEAWRIHRVMWEGVTHVMREEKLGVLRGFCSRMSMYADITRALLNGARSPDNEALATEIRGWIDSEHLTCPQ